MADLPSQIAALQWNNRLKSLALAIVFLVGMAVFALVVLLMIVIPISLIPGSGIDLAKLAAEDVLLRQFIKFFLKVLFFGLTAALYFIGRDISRVERIFHARPLTLKASDPLHRQLENLCISRGLRTPNVYVLDIGGTPAHVVTAAVVQGFSQSALILSEGALGLPGPQKEALMAQAVQRLYTKDTWFLTLLCFMGHFPFHIRRNVNVIGRYLFKLPLLAAETVIAPVRPLIMNMRFLRLDAGSIELTKDPESMNALLRSLSTAEEVEKYFYEPYLPLFITAAGNYRKENLAR